MDRKAEQSSQKSHLDSGMQDPSILLMTSSVMNLRAQPISTAPERQPLR